jgi:TatD DNase family protein
MIIDTHVHIYDEAFDSDLEEVVERAQRNGIVKMIMPGIDSSYHSRMMECTKRLKGYAIPTIGLHPTSVNDKWEDELHFVEEHIGDYPFCAIGEIGIDGYWSKEFLAEQKEVFFRQIIIAQKHNLPIIIHCREGIQEVFDVLERVNKMGQKKVKGTFHAYSGSYESYSQISKFGDFKIGIGGVVTYKNAGIAKVLEKIPLEEIILETDSPWLTPVPYRGKRNESSYLCEIVEKISTITGRSKEEIEEITTKNATILFNITL